MRYAYILSTAMMAVALTACSTTNPKQAGGPRLLPWAGTDGIYQVNFPQPMPGEERFIHLTLRADIREDCDYSPHFAFDEVAPLPQDRVALKEVAECLNRLNVRTYEVALIGRADGRGTTEYNQQLGIKRAGAVRDLLTASGVDPSRIRTQSFGENEAKGAQPIYDHGYDRRVDVVLQGAAHAPGPRLVTLDGQRIPSR